MVRGNLKRIILALLPLSLLLAACSSGGQEATPGGAVSLPTAGVTQPSPKVAPTLSLASAPTLDPIAAATPVSNENAGMPGSAPTSVPSTLIPATEDAQTFLDPTQYEWKPVITGLVQPISLANAGDGSGRLFINEKRGRIIVVQNEQGSGQTFMDITDRVGSRGSEQGLLGLAFDPKYKENGRFYVNYTDKNGNTVISRFKVSGSDPNAGDPGSEEVLLRQDQPYANHNGGEMTFGPDGYLYIGLGDGGSAGDPHGNGQNRSTLLGKILRIDVSPEKGYAIPKDNPFQNGSDRPEIWAYGLRNPWRFSFDMKTGDLYIGDVGQNQWEEVNFLPAGSQGGANFGWSYKEALHPFKGQPPAGVQLVDPVFEYGHDQGCSETGGYIYRGSSMPEWMGTYLLGDYCSGRVWGLLRINGQWQGQQLFDTSYAISSFGQDESGEVYLMDINGSVMKLAKK